MHIFWIVFIATIILFALVPVIGLNVIFLALGFIIALMVIKRNHDIKKNIYEIPKDALHVTNLDKGGVFKLTGVGEDAEDLTLKVLAKHLYQEGDFYWYELECDKGEGEKVWVEIEDDDETIVSIVLKKMQLEDIHTNYLELTRIDDEEKGFITYKRQKYKYLESDRAVFYRYCDNKRAEKFYYWDFVSGNYTISVEKWSDKDYEVFYCQKMNPAQITIFSNTEEEEK